MRRLDCAATAMTLLLVVQSPGPRAQSPEPFATVSNEDWTEIGASDVAQVNSAMGLKRS